MKELIRTNNNTDDETAFLYNGLDCRITLEVMRQLRASFNPNTISTYNFELALQAPLADAMLRGFRIDSQQRFRMSSAITKDLTATNEAINEMALAIWNQPLNPASPLQLGKFFYDYMGLPKVTNYKTGNNTTNREALEKLIANDAALDARPILNLILFQRDLTKQIQFLKSGIHPDGRCRTSFNIAGTDTGRLSSNGSIFGGGVNFQNINDKMRCIYLPDPGCKYAYFDLPQAESRNVGAEVFIKFGDSTYLDACEAGDLHTTVAQMVWPELPWYVENSENANGQNMVANMPGLPVLVPVTGLDNDPGIIVPSMPEPRKTIHMDAKAIGKFNKKVAGTKFYRDWSYRDLAKRGGHLTNYLGTPPTMAKALKIATSIAAAFQQKYLHEAFPGIHQLHLWVAAELIEKGMLVTIPERERNFFGRKKEKATVRLAMAHLHQSSIADTLNAGMLNVWRNVCNAEKYRGRVHLLGQLHDAILVQYPIGWEDEVCTDIFKHLQITHNIKDPAGHERPFTMVSDLKTGFNFGSVQYDKQGNVVGNQSGLKEYKIGQGDSRNEEFLHG